MDTCSVCGRVSGFVVKGGEAVVLGHPLVEQEVALLQVSVATGKTLCAKCVERVIEDSLLDAVLVLRGAHEQRVG
ncbi:MAG: hypothetical protein E6Q97_25660 [Desulfurellales bacterium]|nr:MAG: hypothetical protein E6Q97_25660 [Desulfurellales bacterium]